MSNILVIGGSNGIGKAIVKKLSSTHSVFATYNKNEVKSFDATYFYFNALEEFNDSLLPDVLDGIVYCPGTINLKPFHRITADMFVEDYKIQVVGAINSIQKILPRLQKSEKASIVLFSTVAVQTGFTFHSLVSASKGAIEGLTKSLAAELSPKIRVNCIAPSITQTPLANSLLNTDEKIAANALRHPLKKIGQPEDVSSLACFLLSEEAQWMTGQIVHIDGGISTLKV